MLNFIWFWYLAWIFIIPSFRQQPEFCLVTDPNNFCMFVGLIKAKFVVCNGFNWNKTDNRCYVYFIVLRVRNFLPPFGIISVEKWFALCVSCAIRFHFSSFNQLKLKILFGFCGKSHTALLITRCCSSSTFMKSGRIMQIQSIFLDAGRKIGAILTKRYICIFVENALLL